jgi:hypothetical protein
LFLSVKSRLIELHGIYGGNFMMKSLTEIIGYIISVGFVICMTASAQALTINGLYTTGVDNSGVALPLGSAELHYSLEGLVSPAIVSAPHEQWVAAPAGSAWIGPSAGTVHDPSGDYTYTLAFDLTGLDPSTAVISGLFSTDNYSNVLLNGNSTGISTGRWSYLGLTPFTISEGFTADLNILEFVVNNEVTSARPNPTGLLVADITGSAAALPLPIPAAAWLFGFGILGLVGMARRV